MVAFRKVISAALTTVAFFAPPQAKAQDAISSATVNLSSPPADGASDENAANNTTALAKKLQNPIADLYSFPFQSNTNFNYGPKKGTQEILNIQPVIPIKLNRDWTLITRTILPLIWQPSLRPVHTVPFGTGPTTLSAFLAPATPTNGWLVGAGPIVQLPTASDKTLGSNVWGAGPTGVVVYMKGPIVAGLLVNNVWSFGGRSGRSGTRYNNFLTQPFINYNFGGGWYVYSAPIVTANWLSAGNKAWTLPIGAGFGRVVRLGKLPVNFQLGAYGNILRIQYGSNWSLRTQVTFVF